MKSFAITVILLLMASPGRAGSEFVGGFDDLPLMPGMSELAGELMAFDSPGGRIVENAVQGTTSRQAVLDFYAATLPQLGWVETGPGLFVREDEILKLEFPPRSNAPLIARFTLRPAEK